MAAGTCEHMYAHAISKKIEIYRDRMTVRSRPCGPASPAELSDYTPWYGVQKTARIDVFAAHQRRSRRGRLPQRAVDLGGGAGALEKHHLFPAGAGSFEV